MVLINLSCSDNKNTMVEDLKSLGVIVKLDENELSTDFISKESNTLGSFNHLSEQLDIGFTPNNIYMNFNFPREYYLMTFIGRLEAISNGDIHVKFLKPIKADNYTVHTLINDCEFMIELSNPIGNEDGGLSVIIDLLNQLNSFLEDETINSRFVVFPAREIHTTISYGRQYRNILNYRVSYIPIPPLKELIEKESLRYAYGLNLGNMQNQGSNFASESIKWGNSLPKIKDFIKEDDVLYTHNLDWQIKDSFYRSFFNLFDNMDYQYDQIRFIIFDGKNGSGNQIFKDLLEVPECGIDETIGLEICYQNNCFVLKKTKLFFMQYFDKCVVTFLNDFAVKTKQEYYIGKVYNDYQTYESCKSLIQITPNNYTDHFIKYPHLKLNNTRDYQSTSTIYLRIKKEDPRLFKLGYIAMTENDFYYNLLKKEYKR